MNKENNQSIKKKLYSAILSVDSQEECEAFLKDLCTVPEINAMAQRFEVAEMLYCGKPYKEISELTGASTATISRVKNALDYSEHNGYRRVFERMGIK